MNSNSRGLSSLLALLVLAGLVVGGYFLVKKADPDAPSSVQTTDGTESVEAKASEDGESDVSGKPVTAYIVSIENNTIVLDYVDVLTGERARQVAIEDGQCGGDRKCPALYDRNVDPLTRSFAFAPDVQIISEKDQTLTVEQLKEMGLSFEAYGNRHGQLFNITFNRKNEVSKIEGEFRP